jgi:capsular exopolysaccharide synthesis family protein
MSSNNNKTHSSNGSYRGSLQNYSGQQGDNAKDDPDVVDLRHLFYFLWGHKWIILSVIVVCVFLAGLAAALKTPIYQSEGSILITESQNQYSYAGSDLGNLLTNSYGIGIGSSIADELQILRSRNLSKEIADTLMDMRLMENGRQYPALFKEYPDDSTMAFKDVVASRLRQNLLFNQVDMESNLVNISYESPSAIESADVVNLTIELYSEFSTRQNRKSANAAVVFLEKERNRIENELNRAEVLLQQYMDENELVQVDAQTKAMIDRMTELQKRRQEARTRLVTVNSALEQYQNQLDQIKPGLADQYADALGTNMQQLQFQLTEFKTERMKILSENPGLKENSADPPARLQTLNRQIEDYQNEIRSLTNELLSKSDEYIGFLGNGVTENISALNKQIIELKIEQQQYQSQDDVLTGEINELEQVFDNLPENMMGLARLQRNVKINEQLYITVSQQYAEMSLWQQTQFGKGQLVDEGYIPEVPVEPKTPLYLLVGLVLGGILGIGYVFTKEAFNTTIDGTQKLKQFDVPLLAVVPNVQKYINDNFEGKERTTVQGSEVSTRLVSLLKTVSPAAESFRRLESNILHSNPDSDLKSLMVTSTTQGEGKTTIAANLATVMAEADQKIIIVDTDLRRPNLHDMFGMERSPGLVDVLFEEATLEEALRPTVVPNLSVLCAGKRPPNASAITKSASFLALIKKLEHQYDRVIIDTPPFGIITDSSSLIDQTDGVVVVSKFGETKIGELEHTLHQLERVDAKVMGTVLNGFEADESSDYYYGQNYYKEFYRDYAEYENA